MGKLPRNVSVVGRLRKDAALRTATVPPGSSPRRVRGERLPDLDDLEANADDWQTVTLRKQGRTVKRRVHGLTCQWYHVCRTKPVRVVFVNAPDGHEDNLRLVCNDPTRSDEQIVQAYYDRWGIEECFQEGKQQMGMERSRGWCVRTVTRQMPLAMLIGTLVKLCYLQQDAREPDHLPLTPPWYSTKTVPSFRDMRAALRRALWQDRLTCNSRLSWESNELAEALIYALCEAA